MKVASLSRPMLRLSFNRPMMHQRCPICNLTAGKLVRQKEALHQLGYLGAVEAHLVCVADAQEAKQ